MCGIVGMIAKHDVVPFLADGLKRMEYRGYDSAGIAVYNAKKGSHFSVRRAQGKISELNRLLERSPVSGTKGIGHIRWASHGEPNIVNAHPHSSKNVSVVHNGIIENWQPLKSMLSDKGYVFVSHTDTEVIAHLIQSYLDDGKSAFDAFRSAIKQLEGAYALVAMMESAPDELFVSRLGSPLLVGESDDAMFVGSDALALAPSTDAVRYLEEGDCAIISLETIRIFDSNDTKVERELINTGLKADDTDKGGYPHFMLKEIHEQPTVVNTVIDKYVDRDTFSVKEMPVTFDPQTIDRIAMISCGTGFHVGVLAKYWIESLAGINVDVDCASEYRYRDLIQPKNGLFIAVSQSGETADTLAALRRAKQENQHILSVLNVTSSSMTRESMDVLPIFAGSEICVASTKATVAQMMTILCLSIWLGRQRGILSAEKEQELVKAMIALPEKISGGLKDVSHIQNVAYSISGARDVLYLGRGRSFPIALEGALKLKEISYIHAEAYASGEMKHGAIALIDENVPVVCLVPDDEVTEKSLSNMHEVSARKGRVVLVATEQTCAENDCEHSIIMPEIHPMVSPMLYLIPMQLLSYYAAVSLGTDIDQPRNLAKSVTIE